MAGIQYDSQLRDLLSRHARCLVCLNFRPAVSLRPRFTRPSLVPPAFKWCVPAGRFSATGCWSRHGSTSGSGSFTPPPDRPPCPAYRIECWNRVNDLYLQHNILPHGWHHRTCRGPAVCWREGMKLLLDNYNTNLHLRNYFQPGRGKNSLFFFIISKILLSWWIFISWLRH